MRVNGNREVRCTNQYRWKIDEPCALRVNGGYKVRCWETWGVLYNSTPFENLRTRRLGQCSVQRASPVHSEFAARSIVQ